MFNLLRPATRFGNSLDRDHVDKIASTKKRQDYARLPFTSSLLKYVTYYTVFYLDYETARNFSSSGHAADPC